MSRVVAIGESHEVEGFALAGVTVLSADNEAKLYDIWRQLDPDVLLAILTPAAAETLAALVVERPSTLTVTMPCS